MVWPPIHYFQSLRGDDLPENWFDVGGLTIGFSDTDTVTQVKVMHPTVLAEGDVKSVHTDDDSTAYQNTTGNTAYATLFLKAQGTGTASRHVKIYSGPTADSTTSATLLWEIGNSTNLTMFNANQDTITTRVLKIQNNHYLTLENVDDSRAGTNNFDVSNTGVNYVFETT